MNNVVKSAKKLTVNDMNDIIPAGPARSSKKSGKAKLVTRVLLTVLLLASVAAAVYFYRQYQDVKNDPKSAITENNQAETDSVMTGLRKRLLITESDAPTVARVEDPEKLKTSNAEFYKDIQKGDYLIIFPKRAIIYRQSADQIINVAPIINTSDLKAKDVTTPAASDATDTSNN